MRVGCRDLGRMGYRECWELQQQLFDRLVARKQPGAVPEAGVLAEDRAVPGAGVLLEAGAVPEAGAVLPDEIGTILLVEHPPVYTLGKSGQAENLLVNPQTLAQLGATFFHTDRGGDITFHGPGQVVCYPILDLERLSMGLRRYIEVLEEVAIRTVAHYGIAAGRIPGASGVWITGDGAENPAGQSGAEPASGSLAGQGGAGSGPGDPAGQSGAEPASGSLAGQSGAESAPGSLAGTSCAGQSIPRKICAIGVRSSRYVTMHGFALNVSTDLSWFSRINPCGFTDRGVTSMGRQSGSSIPMEEVKDLIINFLSELLNVKIYKY